MPRSTRQSSRSGCARCLFCRTLAQWGARAEWDVHALIYAPTAPLTVAEIEGLGGSKRAIAWSPKERLLIDLADCLRATAGVPDNLWDALAHAFDGPQLAEIIMVATQYVKVALMTNALALQGIVKNGPAMVAGKGTNDGRGTPVGTVRGR